MVQRLNWRSIFDAPPDAPEDVEQKLTDYFSRFAEPQNYDTHPCLKCGAPKCGFMFGIVTGAGHCRHCGWPARRDHDTNGVVTFRNVVLQYHPDFVTEGETPDPFTGFPYRVTQPKENAA